MKQLHVYMLGSKRGFGQSMDGTAQSVDSCFAQQTMDCPLIPWSAQTEGRKAWIQANHGLKRTKRVFAVAAAPSRKGRGPGIAERCMLYIAVRARDVEARRVARACAYKNVPETGSMRCTQRLVRTSVIVPISTVTDDLRSLLDCVSSLHSRSSSVVPDVVLERFSVNHSRRSWRVSQYRAIVEQCMDCPCEAWIHALSSSIHGLSESMLCAQHIHLHYFTYQRVVSSLT